MPRKRLPWIKLWFEILGDPKMTRLTLAERGCWHEILLLAGQSPIRGKLMLTETEPMTLDDIAKALSLSPNEYPVLESCVEKLLKLDSLRWNEHNCLEVVHFKDRQEVYQSDLIDYHKRDKLRINSELTPEKVLKEEEEEERRKIQKKDNIILVQKEGKEILKGEEATRFELFWKAYPKKRNKGQAERAFKKAAPDEQLMAVILTAIERAKKSAQWLKEDGQFIPYPATWLNARGWEDEFTTQGGINETDKTPKRERRRPVKYIRGSAQVGPEDEENLP